MGRGLTDIFRRHPARALSAILWLVALHSFLIGLALITQPPFLMRWAGFSPDSEHFFPAQDGIFHVLMAVAYLMGAIQVERFRYFIFFSIFVKAGATVFLMIYCFGVEFKWVVLLSGLADFGMGLMITAGFVNYLHYRDTDAAGG